MKKLMIGAAAAAMVGGLMFAPTAVAEPSDACDGSDEVDGVVAVNSADEADPSQGGSVTVCITEGPVTGNGTASGPDNGYIVADGDTTNEGALQGYIGIQTADDGTPEGTSSGCPADYDGEAGGPSTSPESLAEFVQAGGESECDPETGEPVE